MLKYVAVFVFFKYTFLICFTFNDWSLNDTRVFICFLKKCLLELITAVSHSHRQSSFINYIISWVKIFPSRLIIFCTVYILGLQKGLLLLTVELFQRIFIHSKAKTHLWSVSVLIQRFSFCSNKLLGTSSLCLYFHIDPHWSLQTPHNLKVVHPSVASLNCMLLYCFCLRV